MEIILKPISALPQNSTLTGDEMFAFVQGGVTVRGTLAQISSYIQSLGGSSTAFNGNRAITKQGIPGLTGQVLGGNNVVAFLEGLFIAIQPTYNIASISLSQNQPVYGEVGETLTNTITASFNQNDAGVLTAIRIQQGLNDLIPNGTTSPFVKNPSVKRILGTINFQAFANYNAGPIKNTDQGNPDARTPQIRSSNAPQSAESNFASNIVPYIGVNKIFYGSASVIPTTSAGVRALPQSQRTDEGTVFILNTGTVHLNFIVALPPGKTLASAFDLDATGAPISFTSSPQTVNDAGGDAYTSTKYVNTITVAYPSNHRIQITIS